MSWQTAPTNAVDYSTAPLALLYTLKAADLGPVDFVVVRDRILAAWDDAKKKLETAKADEMDLRKVFTAFVSDPNKTSGTENVELNNGYVAKIVKKENYGFVKNDEGKIDKKAIDSALDAIEAKVDGGHIIAERLVKWTPDLSLTEYKLLPTEAKVLIDAVIVVTPGAPTLEIKAPKGSK